MENFISRCSESGQCPHKIGNICKQLDEMQSPWLSCCNQAHGSANILQRFGVILFSPKALPIVHSQARGWFPGHTNTLSWVLMHVGVFANLLHVEMKIGLPAVDGILCHLSRDGLWLSGLCPSLQVKRVMVKILFVPIFVARVTAPGAQNPIGHILCALLCCSSAL